jgi:hypothetical protein
VRGPPTGELSADAGQCGRENLLFVSHGAEHTGQSPDINETQKVEWISLTSVPELIERGDIAGAGFIRGGGNHGRTHGIIVRDRSMPPEASFTSVRRRHRSGRTLHVLKGGAARRRRARERHADRRWGGHVRRRIR